MVRIFVPGAAGFVFDSDPLPTLPVTIDEKVKKRRKEKITSCYTFCLCSISKQQWETERIGCHWISSTIIPGTIIDIDMRQPVSLTQLG